jgi:hypothetical protein
VDFESGERISESHSTIIYSFNDLIIIVVVVVVDRSCEVGKRAKEKQKDQRETGIMAGDTVDNPTHKKRLFFA